MNDYTLPTNHPHNVSSGRVVLFCKAALPLKPPNDLACDEVLVVELKFGRKKMFFTVFYRTPSVKHTSPEFEGVLNNFKSLHSNIQAEYPFASFFTGYFNWRSQSWWAEERQKKKKCFPL